MRKAETYRGQRKASAKAAQIPWRNVPFNLVTISKTVKQRIKMLMEAK